MKETRFELNLKWPHQEYKMEELLHCLAPHISSLSFSEGVH